MIVLGRKPGGSGGGGGAPSGPAGGVLSGTYPNPGFANQPVLEGDAAGGVLSGTYPDPGFAVDMATQAELNAVAAAVGAKLFDSALVGDNVDIDTGANGIVGTWSVLEVWMVMRTTQAAVGSSVQVTVNNDTGNNYDQEDFQILNTTGTGGPGLAGANWTLHAFGANAQSGAAAVSRMSIPGYSATVFHKSGEYATGQVEDTAADARARWGGLRWRNTAAITRMRVAAASGNLLAGSRLIIYGR